MSRRWLAMGALCLAGANAAAQDGPLASAVEAARRAWLGHDVRELVAHSDTVRLRIPDVAAAQALRPAQAARILSGWLAEADEGELTLHDIRQLADDHAYAELRRRYTVRGTAEQRTERVFFGFRRTDGVWRLREIRVTR